MDKSQTNYQGDARYSLDVLDHGFVAIRNISGPTHRGLQHCFDASDIDPAQAARMSFGQMGSERTREMDLKLYKYLKQNSHNTPIEMVEVWIEMKLPIFVARQFVRHRTCTINEISGRYVQLPAEWYIPQIVGGKAANKKQGQEDNLHPSTQEKFRSLLNGTCERSYKEYELALAEGIAPEHARLFLHLNHYTHWLWKQDLHNLIHFLKLRSHSHAQIEAQQYAKAILRLLEINLPYTIQLFIEENGEFQ